MQGTSANTMRAVLFLGQDFSPGPISQTLSHHGFLVHCATDYQNALQEHRQAPFALAVVDEAYESGSASAIIQDLLKIDWTTHAIVISKTDESQLHEETEGLGILGSIRDAHDVEKLAELLWTLKKILGRSSE